MVIVGFIFDWLWVVHKSTGVVKYLRNGERYTSFYSCLIMSLFILFMRISCWFHLYNCSVNYLKEIEKIQISVDFFLYVYFAKESCSIDGSTDWGRCRLSGSSRSRQVLEITRSCEARGALQAFSWPLAGEVRMQSSMGSSTICSSCSRVCCFHTSSTTTEEGKRSKYKEKKNIGHP